MILDLFRFHPAEAAAMLDTIARRLAGIRYVHATGGHPNPTNDERVRVVIRGIRRTRGTAPGCSILTRSVRSARYLPPGRPPRRIERRKK
jgi:hypothetical protein